MTLSSTVGGSPQSVITNETGTYQFSQITPGQYTFREAFPVSRHSLELSSCGPVTRTSKMPPLRGAHRDLGRSVCFRASNHKHSSPTLASSNRWQRHRTHPAVRTEAAISGSGARSGDSGLRATPRRCGCERSGCLAPAGSVSWQREFLSGAGRHGSCASVALPSRDSQWTTHRIPDDDYGEFHISVTSRKLQQSAPLLSRRRGGRDIKKKQRSLL